VTPILEGLPSQQVDAIDRFVRGQMHTAGLPGLALTVTSGAEALYGGGFGATRMGGSPMTPDTCCQIGSTTKSMTAAAVLNCATAAGSTWTHR
jgi:CubicO group peptidase (beta-lactamase class C family)